MNKIEELERIKAECQTCKACGLHLTRTNTVFSDGIANHKLMLIGEAPGANEDQTGKPFVGRAGHLLDKIMDSANLSREKNLYICNTIKCRPPENRNPEAQEKLACRHFLDAQIKTLKPKIILVCGKVAMESMLNTKEGISKMRGKWFDGPYGSKIMPIFHPSYLLRNHSLEIGSPRWLMQQDIQAIKRLYDEL